MNVKPGTPPLYVWFDTEYSTLEIEEAFLLQVAAMVTDSRLRRILPAERDIRLTIRPPASGAISPWVEEHLPDLVRECRSPAAVSVGDADERLAAYVRAALGSLTGQGIETGQEGPILAGNSIHIDKRLAHRFLPGFAAILHYRIMDVTALKLEWKRLRRKREFDKEKPEDILKYFPEAKLPESGLHDAYYDAQASCAELAFYRLYLLR